MIKPSRTLVLTGLLLVSVILSILGPGTGNRLREWVHVAFAPLGQTGWYLTSSIKDHVRVEPDVSQEQARRAVRDNERLRAELASLQARYRHDWQKILAGQTVFSTAFGWDPDVPVRLVSAEIIAADTLPYGWGRLVNKGARSGAAEGAMATTRRLRTDRAKALPPNLAVLAGEALVGRITESGAFSSRVQLVSDRGFEIPAQIYRVIDPENPRTIQYNDRIVRLLPEHNAPVLVYAQGDGATGLHVPEVKEVESIRPGDILQTRPSSGAMPAAVTIGVVTDVQRDHRNAGLVNIRVEAAADLASLREVYIVVPRMARFDEGGD